MTTARLFVLGNGGKYDVVFEDGSSKLTVLKEDDHPAVVVGEIRVRVGESAEMFCGWTTVDDEAMVTTTGEGEMVKVDVEAYEVEGDSLEEVVDFAVEKALSSVGGVGVFGRRWAVGDYTLREEEGHPREMTVTSTGGHLEVSLRFYKAGVVSGPLEEGKEYYATIGGHDILLRAIEWDKLEVEEAEDYVMANLEEGLPFPASVFESARRLVDILEEKVGELPIRPKDGE